MEYTEQVLVLQIGRFKEADVWVRLLSPTKGLFSAFAFGGSRSRQRFPGCLDIFNHVLFRIKTGGGDGYVALQEGVLVKGVARLRTDRSRLGLARNCAKFLQAFGVGPEGAAKAHNLLAATLELLEGESEIPSLFPLYFRARLAFDHGYGLDLDHCNNCGVSFAGDGAVMLVRDGMMLCGGCASAHQGFRVALDEESCHVLRTVGQEPPSAWSGLTLSAKARSACSMAIDGFIQHHVGLGWDRGRFVKV